MAKTALGQDSLIGRTLGHYRIIEEIGAGGMGVVYRAYDEHLDRDVAVKIIRPGLLGEDSACHRFHKEAPWNLTHQWTLCNGDMPEMHLNSVSGARIHRPNDVFLVFP